MVVMMMIMIVIVAVMMVVMMRVGTGMSKPFVKYPGAHRYDRETGNRSQPDRNLLGNHIVKQKQHRNAQREYCDRVGERDHGA